MSKFMSPYLVEGSMEWADVYLNNGFSEESTDECFIIPVKDRNEKTLMPIIKEKILPGRIIMFDCWKAYSNLVKDGFQNSYNFVDLNTLCKTQKVERLWRSMKWGNKRRRGTNRDFLETYLSEFMWRQDIGNDDTF